MAERNGDRRSWDQYYESVITKGCRTDWEKLPLDDLKRFVEEAKLMRLSKISTVLEAGCGRGFRTLVLALNLLNREDVRIYALDFATKAIEYAKKCLSDLEANGSRDIGSLVPEHVRPRCKITFESRSFLEDLPSEWPQEFDLVVDWMCFHEIPADQSLAYARRLSDVTKRFLIICAFSEKSQFARLTSAVHGVVKTTFDETYLRTLFSDFEIVFTQEYCDNPNPVPPHEDGPIAAKRAYLLVKRLPELGN